MEESGQCTYINKQHEELVLKNLVFLNCLANAHRSSYYF